MSATYLLVSHAGERVTRHATAAAAIARGAMLDRCVASATGGRGGMDCHVVVDRDGELSYRGMVCGRSIIGRGFGCGAAVVEQARAKLPASAPRDPDRIGDFRLVSVAEFFGEKKIVPQQDVGASHGARSVAGEGAS